MFQIGVPTTSVIQKVFAISCDQTSSGSALAYPIDGGHCFITAAHVIKKMEPAKDGNFWISKSGRWFQARGTPFFCAPDIDIAILCTLIPSNEDGRLSLSSHGAQLGQDAYFLGFPYFGGAVTYEALDFNEGFPVPLIKKCILSSVSGTKIYLDGHNNPGFSGGPVSFWNYSEKRQMIAGVISGYLNQWGKVHQFETATENRYGENSGIGVAYNIKHAVNLMKEVYGRDFPL